MSVEIQSLKVVMYNSEKEHTAGLHCRLEPAQLTDTSNCIEVLKKAISRHEVPEIINSDQGCQFTGKEWADPCSRHSEMKVSMDGRGRAKDNIWIERF